jgi:chromosome segregation protein
LAQQRAIEADIERLRTEQVEANDAFSVVQGEFYGVGNEITRIEQAIEHARETRAQQKREQEQLEATYADAAQHLGGDRSRLDELTSALDALIPTLNERTQARDAASTARVDAERALNEWQQQWDAFNSQAAESRRTHEIESTRVGQIEEHISRLETRRARLQDEVRQIDERRAELPVKRLRDEAAELDEVGRTQEQEIATLEAQLRDARTRREELTNALDTQRSEASAAEARLLSLQELQAHAERRDDTALHGWLESRRLGDAPRLADRLRVETGWEKAVERVLGADLVALCVQGVDAVTDPLPERTGVTLFDTSAGVAPRATGGRPGLLNKLTTDLDLAPLLDGIYVAETLAEALVMRSALAAHESIVTRDGDRVGCNWLRLGMASGETTGLLSRRQEIEQLQSQIESIRRRLGQDQFQLGQVTDEVGELERRREESARRLNELHRSRAETRERLGHHEAQLAQIDERANAVAREMSEVDEQMRADRSGLDAARDTATRAQADLPSIEQRRADLAAKRDSLQTQLDAARVAENDTRDALHRLEIERESRQTEMASTRASIERLEGQLATLTTRRAELQQLLADDRHPEAEFKQKLDTLLQQRLGVEERLSQARQVVTGLEGSIREQDQQRQQFERDTKAARERLESERVARESFVVRRDTLTEQLTEVGTPVEEVIQGLPPEATEPEWAERLEKTAARIERLGPINLVAIEEFDEASTRKTYLDKQHEDLSQALATLEEAIRKMDRETKSRFKETYDKVNEGFQRFFPQLFGGGSAYLDLTDADLLESGVSVMARPPGKRNSTIHLLSGGEKALTAVALLFSIFELNPAPFCLLDEVDAPLDDVNVQRYAECLKVMAERTQLMYISHNKISMEMADILLGVTMSEPGVSRLVAVDVDEALAMVAK